MKSWYALGAATLLAIVVGCGGSGGGTTGTGGSGGTGGTSAPVSLFATDNLSTGYDHVYVSIKKVELTAATGDRVLFDEAAGKVVDLRSLRDDLGRRFRMLSNRAIQSGNFTGIRVTVDDNATVFPTGATTGIVGTFEGSDGGSKVLTLSFPTPQSITPGVKLIIDFDLANWNLDGTVLSATDGKYLALVEDSSISNNDRHDRDEYHGTISNLAGTSPTQTFSLTRGASTVVVKTDANTSIFNENGAPSPALVEGARVEVYGAFSTADSAIIASRIKIDNVDDNDRGVKGKITSFTTDTNTISVEMERPVGFLPTSRTLTINYTADSKFFGNRGLVLTEAAFEAQLANGGFIEAEGPVTAGVMTARKLKIEDGDDDQGHHGGGNGGGDNGGHGRDVEIRGDASNGSAANGTFSVTVHRWEGLALRDGMVVSVKTAENTEFKVNGSDANAAAFFEAIATGLQVQVEGTFDPETKIITATEVKAGR